MQKIHVTFIFVLITFASIATAADNCETRWANVLEKNQIPEGYSEIIGLCNRELRAKLQKLLEKDQRPLHYNQAKKALIRDIDNRGPRGVACSVYSPDDCMDNAPLNLEHTWPRSKGAGKKPAISDLHHLYMAETSTNSMRSDYPFCDVVDVSWSYGGSKLGRSSANRQECFEPPQGHKGNVARSMFYFSVRYYKGIGQTQENFLRMWHQQDPVTQDDIIRNNLIKKVQGTDNPFVIMPYLTDLIWDF